MSKKDSSAVSRVKKELLELAKEAEPPVRVSLVAEDAYLHLLGEIDGPQDTVYQGGVWKVDIVIPSNYPFEPPKMKFVTHLWHPNVSSQTGAICLDILKDNSVGGAWSPALTMRTALMSLQALMCAPEPKDPQDAVVARQYMDERKAWEAKAREWTRVYASAGGAGGGGGAPPLPPPPPPAAAQPAEPAVPRDTPAEYRGAVASLMAMGFEGDKALAALRAARGNVQLAAERLLQG
jgi:ubiquitin-conjugating enzyme (huntingtin interacting protein 2)